MKPSNYNRLKWILKTALSLLLLVAAVMLLDWDAIVDSVAHLSLGGFTAICLLLILEFPILGIRWHILVNGLTKITVRRQLRHYFIGVFLNNFTPAQIGGDVYRFYMLKDISGRRLELFALLVKERVIGLVGFLIFFVGCYLGYLIETINGSEYPDTTITILASLFTFLVGGYFISEQILILLRKLNLQNRIRGASQFFEVINIAVSWKTKRNLFTILALSLLGGAVIWTGAVQLATWHIAPGVSIFVLGMVAIGSDLIRVMPLTIQGIGMREGTFAFLFSLFGLPAEEGFVIGAVSYIALSLAMVIIGLIGKLMEITEVKVN